MPILLHNLFNSSIVIPVVDVLYSHHFLRALVDPVWFATPKSAGSICIHGGRNTILEGDGKSGSRQIGELKIGGLALNTKTLTFPNDMVLSLLDFFVA